MGARTSAASLAVKTTPPRLSALMEHSNQRALLAPTDDFFVLPKQQTSLLIYSLGAMKITIVAPKSKEAD